MMYHAQLYSFVLADFLGIVIQCYVLMARFRGIKWIIMAIIFVNTVDNGYTVVIQWM